MALFMVKTWMGNKATPIYGAEWAGGSDPSWSRTDDAVGFSAPNPYYSGMSTTPSSPFDNIMPWSGMRRVTDANADELVEIPKFWYKWTRDGVKMKLQISMEQFDGSHVSPAHMDRGDGVGERDYVYVGRYHCASDYKSKTGVTPKGNATRSTFRTGIHNLGNNIWQNDFAIYWTIRLLYLVEYANWNVQATIGYGCGNGSSLQNEGATDSMPYHTGTVSSSRSTYGATQYRHIENLYGNIGEFVDGISSPMSSVSNVRVVINPASFADSDTASGGTLVGTGRTNTRGVIMTYSAPSVTGYEWALYPTNISGTDLSKYVCDMNIESSSSSSDVIVLRVGAAYGQSQNAGLFNWQGDFSEDSTAATVGSRLMVLPPSRLSA